MLTSLNSGVSGLQQFQNQLDVIGNNISNSNTIGYKSNRADFAEAFSQTLSSSGDGSPVQVGTGVTTGDIRTRFGQGTINTSTGVATDLAIDKDGFFVVKDATSNAQYATRAGDFELDGDGNLITSGGLRVQGYSDAGLTTVGDIKIDGTGRPAASDPAASVKSFAVDDSGKISVVLSDGTSFVRGQILLQRFTNPQALVREGSNLYSGIAAAGPLGGAGTPAPQAPGSNGLGSIRQYALETSNVDLAGEFAGLITAQRGFQASARLITTSDEILQEMVNLKR